MAKLTLHFKNKAVKVFRLDEGNSTIGRDPSNTFTIDSLAVAPTHLTISFENNQFYIESLSEQFPSFINGKSIQKHPLQQSDRIVLTKHELIFSDDAIDIGSLPQKLNNPAPSNNSPTRQITLASIQVMNGADIGRVISLSSALTEVKDGDSVPAIIARRQSGYFISKLIDDVELQINDELTETEAKLENNSKFRIGDRKYVFFTD
ncbi:MAG: phosphopeptide-binding protein [Piscirickettsiaceae bacterium]|nr:MAG: phosphopeptide-binding protein [Piscirickettsiaceae bacterium]PCI70990.1 MAG: phosphopeptide-binding protein [Piscirickettsiaceae bacterium]